MVKKEHRRSAIPDANHQEQRFAGTRKLQSAATSCAPGTTASYADETLGFRFRSENITVDSDGTRWDAVVPPGLAFVMRRPADQFADDNSGGFYSYGNNTEPSVIPPPGVNAGMHFESGPAATFDQMMSSNQKVAVGAANTFFAVLTPASNTQAADALLAFRPNDGPGCMGWLLASMGCPETGPGEANEGAPGCVIVDDWAPSGFYGPAFQGDVTQIVIWRSRLTHNSLVRSILLFDTIMLTNLPLLKSHTQRVGCGPQGVRAPVVDMAVLEVGNPISQEVNVCTHDLCMCGEY
jgi:hypothetical protein